MKKFLVVVVGFWPLWLFFELHFEIGYSHDEIGAWFVHDQLVMQLQMFLSVEMQYFSRIFFFQFFRVPN